MAKETKLNAYVLTLLLLLAGFAVFAAVSAEIGLAITVGAFLALLIGLGTTIWFLPALAIDAGVFIVAATVWAGAEKNLQNFVMGESFLIALFLNLLIFVFAFAVADSSRRKGKVKIAA